MLRIPMPSGIVTQPISENASSSYLSWERGFDAAYVAALFYGSWGLLDTAAVTAFFPPLSAVLIVGAGLGLSASLALSVVVLTPLTDEQLHQVFAQTSLFTPALFLVPIGAVVGGEEGIKATQDIGGIAWDVFSFGAAENFAETRSLLKKTLDRGSAGYVLYRDLYFTREDYGLLPDQFPASTDDESSAVPNSILLKRSEEELDNQPTFPSINLPGSGEFAPPPDPDNGGSGAGDGFDSPEPDLTLGSIQSSSDGSFSVL